jgi:hypothetical protein
MSFYQDLAMSQRACPKAAGAISFVSNDLMD